MKATLRIVGGILVLAFGAAPWLAPEATELYRWTDEKGVVHYSDKKPEGIAAERRKIEEPSRSGAESAEGAESTESGEAEDATEEDDGIGPDPNSPECLTARSNLEALQAEADVAMDVDGDGEAEVLDAEARQRAIEQHQALVRQNCGE